MRRDALRQRRVTNTHTCLKVASHRTKCEDEIAKGKESMYGKRKTPSYEMEPEPSRSKYCAGDGGGGGGGERDA